MVKGLGKVLMIQGTGSGVGKSIIVAGLCRILKEDGYRVAPFKAQNMALNSFVTKDGKEMGRAQVVQAEAAGLEPCCEMNPILIKPNTDTKAQIIVMGKPIGSLSAVGYRKFKARLKDVIISSFNRLISRYDVVIAEGAGSPAEINLKEDDVVNMNLAKQIQAPVILVGDIDKGGVFAWLWGTISLLDEQEQNLIKGFIINKFRGDKRILRPGLSALERLTNKKVFGVIPYIKDLRIDEEDSLSSRLDKSRSFNDPHKIHIEVLYLPHISNFTDFEPFRCEPDVSLRYVTEGESFDIPDLIILPGTKNTIFDLRTIRKLGYDTQIDRILKARPHTVLLGICGGFQMLGENIADTFAIESKDRSIRGLGYLPIMTYFVREKSLYQVQVHICHNRFFRCKALINGYEIHMGVTKNTQDLSPFATIIKENGRECFRYEGAISNDGRVMGTYLHGVFENSYFRRDFINYIRTRKGLSALLPQGKQDYLAFKQKQYTLLADCLRKNINMDLIYNVIGV